MHANQHPFRMFRPLFLFLFCALGIPAFAAEIFFPGNWDETLQKAKKENKLIFVDCYTDWCTWCKVMDRQTFPDTAVTRELTSHYVAIRREMQQTDEGRRLRLKYQVQGFPTYLILSPDGHLLGRIDGYWDADVFLQKLRYYLLPGNQQPLPGYSTKLDPGYPQYCLDAMDPAKDEETRANEDHYVEMTRARLDSMPDKRSEVAWGLMWMFPEVSFGYGQWTCANFDTLGKLYGSDNVKDRVMSYIATNVAKAAHYTDLVLLNQALADCRYLGADSGSTRFEIRVQYASMVSDWKMLQQILQQYADTADFSKNNPAYFLNDRCWDIYERCDDSSVVASATGWMEKSSRLYPEYALLDTYAALLYKSGQFAKAEPVAEQAIAQGKKEEKDTAATEELLQNTRKQLHSAKGKRERNGKH